MMGGRGPVKCWQSVRTSDGDCSVFLFSFSLSLFQLFSLLLCDLPATFCTSILLHRVAFISGSASKFQLLQPPLFRIWYISLHHHHHHHTFLLSAVLCNARNVLCLKEGIFFAFDQSGGLLGRRKNPGFFLFSYYFSFQFQLELSFVFVIANANL